jgi:copper(I)-binding protein
VIAEPSTPPAPVNRARRTSRFAALATAAVLVSGLLAGCGAGQISETAKQHPTTGGSNADLGKIALRNMQIQAPKGATWDAGDTVALTMTIVNNTDAADKLVAVTTDAANKVMIFPGSASYLAYLGSLPQAAASTSPAGPAPSASGSPAASASNPGVSASPTATTAGATQTPTGAQPNANQSTDPSANSTSSSAGSASAATPSASAPVVASPAGSVTVPSNEAVQFGYDTANRPVILIVGLTAPISGGSVATLTFTFATAGTVTAAVPVSQTQGGAGDSPTLNLKHEGGMGAKEN